MKTLALLNPNAASGRSLRAFEQVRPQLEKVVRSLDVAITRHAGELAGHLTRARDEGVEMVLALGGDGTNLAVVNALAAQPDHPFIFASLPFGTGQDWARGLGIPREPEAAVRWLAAAKPQRVDLGEVRLETGQVQRFLNVASAGLSGEVARRTNAARVKRPWTFLQATVSTLLQFGPPHLRVTLDGELWYEGDAYLLAVGNGRYFGRGMKVCPDAQIDDGAFDVVLIEGKTVGEALVALPSLFKGTHVRRSDVHTQRARHVRVEALGSALDMEMDGEATLDVREIEFQLLAGALPMLVGG